MAAFSPHPAARSNNLVVNKLRDEVLVYDLESDQASCLNQTATLVFKYSDGSTGVEEIAAKVSHDLGTPADVRLVWYALSQLDKKNLLQEHLTIPSTYTRLTRRDFIRAGAIGAAVAIPVIVSLAAPNPAMAATGSCFGRACNNNNDCCPA